MKYSNSTDPYCYPETGVLRNRFGINDLYVLEMKEAQFSRIRYEQRIPKGKFNYAHFKAIHRHLFKDIYDWAGKPRTINISKGKSFFANHEYIDTFMESILSNLKDDADLKNQPKSLICNKLAYYFGELNAVHPFREGNGRTLRCFVDCLCKKNQLKIEWHRMDKNEYLLASIMSFNGNNNALGKLLFQNIKQIKLTKRINQKPSVYDVYL